MARVNKLGSPSRGFLTPPPAWNSRPRHFPANPMSERKWSSPPVSKGDTFHVIHKVPAGDSPYVKAKQVQLIEKDPSRAISLFWAAINAGDRVDSALKDMAIVMKQLNRSDEAIEAIKSFRHLCPYDAQESLDNVLLELYKRSGRIEEEIEMLQRKLKNIEEGTIFGGKRTKIARSQGKKVQITIEQEKSRILGNLAWAYLQLNNYTAAEDLYRKALCLEPDKNKQCNLAICLMHTNRIPEARSLLHAVKASSRVKELDESCARSLERALQMLNEVESGLVQSTGNVEGQGKNSGTKSASPLCSPQTALADRWKKGLFSEKIIDRRVCSPGENQITGINVSSANKNAFSSPSAGRIVKTPSTEPRRRCSWGFSGRDERRDAWESNAVGVYEDGEKTKLPTEPPIDDDDGRASETILYEGRNPSSCANKAAKPVHDSLTGRSKKSWADMVEEEESLCGKVDFITDLLKESSFSSQAGFGTEEEFNDENLDSNIEMCIRKEIDLEDGNYPSGQVRNLKRTESSGCYSSSSLTKRALNFKDVSVVVSSEMDCKSMNHGRKNRLQVFQDITGTM